MNPEDLLRMIDVLHRANDIPNAVLFDALEEANAAAVPKRPGVRQDCTATVARRGRRHAV